ncbi:MAG: hypothetical protein JSR19_10120 [Proteobacteria bacterium]|nr:hypothetical protein [Pseudomonadota bacterium]HQR03222.1 hypothetical protein [Rhodocyclaceae bacterium]
MPMQTSDHVTSLNRLFIQALLRMGDAGEIDAACRLAAQGWSLLRHDHPHEAERLNGAMHNLTNPKRRNNQLQADAGAAIPFSQPR